MVLILILYLEEKTAIALSSTNWYNQKIVASKHSYSANQLKFPNVLNYLPCF